MHALRPGDPARLLRMAGRLYPFDTCKARFRLHMIMLRGAYGVGTQYLAAHGLPSTSQ